MGKLTALLSNCNYYKGEDNYPEDVPFVCWESEELYVRKMMAGDEGFFKSAVDFFCNMGLDKEPDLKDGTPIELQALLFERFCHNSDTDPEVLAGYFPKFYVREWQQKDCSVSLK